MIKTIIFDFGGVLGSEAHTWESNFKEIVSLTGMSPREIQAIFERHWPKLKIGKEKAEPFWKDVATQAKIRVGAKELEKVYSSKISLNKAVLELAENLKKRNFRLAILANESKEWMNIKIKKFHLKSIFDKIYCSAFLGVAKPSTEIFEYVLNDLCVSGENIVFIDNQRNNVRAAKELGIKGILFQNLTQTEKDLGHLLRDS